METLKRDICTFTRDSRVDRWINRTEIEFGGGKMAINGMKQKNPTV